ncbi:hypothetical protein LL06_19580 [Hoeflea sp. BAL378]|uniref:hypothetical protein n=1 Tax=Hoeflea sp. BAL378 TaxID=1547437 RepID=UPI000513840A|nr:hypothetical protein [Hoeflea sp. BAL378]KGF67929.1 hypothetical protein LL06_19580 [Hoeflea sp. BAL378]
MNENLFEIETWRNQWFYKFGSEYTGPYRDRSDAVAAAAAELAPLASRYPASMRATLADLASA